MIHENRSLGSWCTKGSDESTLDKDYISHLNFTKFPFSYSRTSIDSHLSTTATLYHLAESPHIHTNSLLFCFIDIV